MCKPDVKAQEMVNTQPHLTSSCSLITLLSGESFYDQVSCVLKVKGKGCVPSLIVGTQRGGPGTSPAAGIQVCGIDTWVLTEVKLNFTLGQVLP
jgi:hypothetical protein